MKKLSLSLASEIGALAHIHESVARLAEDEQWSARLSYQIDLVLEELTVNIVSYGQSGGDGGKDDGIIEVKIASDANQVTLEVSDNGLAFDPLTDAPAPDLESSVASRPLGGLGVHLVHTLMDEVHYQRENGMNRLTMVKRRDE